MFNMLASGHTNVFGDVFEHLGTILIGAWVFTLSCYTASLATKDGRDKYIKLLRLKGDIKALSAWSYWYRKGLTSALEILHKWFGRPFGGQALFFNTSLAIFYAIFFFVLSWMLGRSGKLCSIQILPKIDSLSWRFFWVSFFSLAFIVILKSKWIVSFISKTFSLNLSDFIVKLLALALALVVGAGALALATATGAAGAALALAALAVALAVLVLVLLALRAGSVVSEAVAVVVTVAVIAAIAVVAAPAPGATVVVAALALAVVAAIGVAVTVVVVAVAVALTVAGAVAAVGATLVVIVAVGKGKYYLAYSMLIAFFGILFFCFLKEWKFLTINGDVVIYLFFIILLPFINGFVDFLSFAASRKLGSKMVIDLKLNKLSAFGMYFIVDLVIAVLLLLLLIIMICFSVTVFNNLIIKDTKLMIDLQGTNGIVTLAKNDPFGANGLWVTLMIFSTLVPTSAHLFAASYGLFTVLFAYKKQNLHIADIIKNEKGAIRFWLPQCYLASRLWLSIALPVAVLFGIGWIAIKINLADWLYAVAMFGCRMGENPLSGGAILLVIIVIVIVVIRLICRDTVPADARPNL